MNFQNNAFESFSSPLKLFLFATSIYFNVKRHRFLDILLELFSNNNENIFRSNVCIAKKMECYQCYNIIM